MNYQKPILRNLKPDIEKAICNNGSGASALGPLAEACQFGMMNAEARPLKV